MKIVHFSDWHWSFRHLPKADLYICTGDMFENYPVVTKPEKEHPLSLVQPRYEIVPTIERERQREDAAEFIKSGGIGKFLASPDAPLICVRGNHDFIPLKELFADHASAHELVDNEVIEIRGVRVTGHRGIPRIYGTWNDEIGRDDLREKVRAMPEAEIYLTHYPPHGILDVEHDFKTGPISYGLEGMKDELFSKMPPVALHCFGHIHGSGRRTAALGGGSLVGGEGPCAVFSNAACGFNVIDIDF